VEHGLRCHDMLDYFELDPWMRSFPPEQQYQFLDLRITYTENFMLAPSATDEVPCYGKSNLLNKMPAMTGRQFANVRAPAGLHVDPSRQEKPFSWDGVRRQRAELNVWGS